MRELETLFERPPTTEANLAAARARFVDRAAKSRPRGWKRLGPFLAALATALVGMTVAVFLRPVSVGPSPQPEPPLLSGAEILRRAADLAEAQPLLKAKPGEFRYVRAAATTRGPRGSTIHMTYEVWTPADGEGLWLDRQTTEDVETLNEETLNPVLCPHLHPPSWPTDLNYHITKGIAPTYANKFENITSEIRLAAAYPLQTAGLLRVAAEFPGLIVKGGIKDAAGRPGVSVVVDTVGDTSSQELLFDPRTYRFLGVRTLYLGETMKDTLNPGKFLKKGDPLGRWALLSVGVAQALPAREDGIRRYQAPKDPCPEI
ncbi:hypothetical protein GCM10009555_012440 [Acrocarpospora macrocephala]|uniref:Uncharacterized protein n=1 Tax=Acrocarpospora macrocephala TaxID=150177 RepID=A0A5M3XC71_9ACTN|nr:hypothetical protein [Acrocarpospora macrocephala]GES16463.1 hypothetical protein Amac_100610 [Acrocarpospora macrocephala]